MSNFLFRNQTHRIYFKFLIAITIGLLFSIVVKAQIVSHDIVPDDSIKYVLNQTVSESLQYDLDTNGSMDIYVASGRGISPNGCSYPYEIDPVYGIVFSAFNYSGWFATNLNPSYPIGDMLKSLNYNQRIDKILLDGFPASLGYYYFWGENLPKVRAAHQTCHNWYYPILPTNYGWPIGSIKYAGFKVVLNGTDHYGWMKVYVVNATTVLIQSYAYNTVPDAPIAAGRTVDIYAGIENNIEDQIILSQTENLYNIELPTELINKQHKIRVVDVVGRLIQEIPATSDKIQFQINEPGIFIINIVGNIINWNKKVIVQ